MDFHTSQLTRQLRFAAAAGDVAAVQAALEAGADPNRIFSWDTALIAAIFEGHLACVQQLLAAGAGPNVRGSNGWTPLHWAAINGRAECVALLLAAGADPAAEVDCRLSPLILAVGKPHLALPVVKALLTAAPQLALRRTKHGLLPLDLALGRGHGMEFTVARCLMKRGALPPARHVLASLKAARRRWHTGNVPLAFYALHAPLAARQPLTSGEWKRVPVPCPGLGAALPAVLARSEAEARALVRCLEDEDRGRLRAALLCIRLHEKRLGSSLPAELLNPLLLAVVDPAFPPWLADLAAALGHLFVDDEI